MSRPQLDSEFCYTRGNVVAMTGASAAQVNKVAKHLLKKKLHGPGNFREFSLDDALRVMVAKELLRLNVQVASMPSLFAAIEKDWSYLRSARAVVEGAALVLVLRPLGPTGAGQLHLTTAARAVAWLKSHHSVVVIDVNALIKQLEERTGERYTPATADRGTTAPIA